MVLLPQVKADVTQALEQGLANDPHCPGCDARVELSDAYCHRCRKSLRCQTCNASFMNRPEALIWCPVCASRIARLIPYTPYLPDKPRRMWRHLSEAFKNDAYITYEGAARAVWPNMPEHWHESEQAKQRIRMLIIELRARIGDSNVADAIIVNLRGVGYRLTRIPDIMQEG